MTYDSGNVSIGLNQGPLEVSELEAELTAFGIKFIQNEAGQKPNAFGHKVRRTRTKWALNLYCMYWDKTPEDGLIEIFKAKYFTSKEKAENYFYRVWIPMYSST